MGCGGVGNVAAALPHSSQLGSESRKGFYLDRRTAGDFTATSKMLILQ